MLKKKTATNRSSKHPNSALSSPSPSLNANSRTESVGKRNSGRQAVCRGTTASSLFFSRPPLSFHPFSLSRCRFEFGSTRLRNAICKQDGSVGIVGGTVSCFFSTGWKQHPSGKASPKMSSNRKEKETFPPKQARLLLFVWRDQGGPSLPRGIDGGEYMPYSQRVNERIKWEKGRELATNERRSLFKGAKEASLMERPSSPPCYDRRGKKKRDSPEFPIFKRPASIVGARQQRPAFCICTEAGSCRNFSFCIGIRKKFVACERIYVEEAFGAGPKGEGSIRRQIACCVCCRGLIPVHPRRTLPMERGGFRCPQSRSVGSPFL